MQVVRPNRRTSIKLFCPEKRYNVTYIVMVYGNFALGYNVVRPKRRTLRSSFVRKRGPKNRSSGQPDPGGHVVRPKRRTVTVGTFLAPLGFRPQLTYKESCNSLTSPSHHVSLCTCSPFNLTIWHRFSWFLHFALQLLRACKTRCIARPVPAPCAPPPPSVRTTSTQGARTPTVLRAS